RPIRVGRRSRHLMVVGSDGRAGRDPDDPAYVDLPPGPGRLSRLLDTGLPGHRRLRSSHKGDLPMRFMMLVKASQESEAGVMPSGGLVRREGGVNQETAEGGGVVGRR